MAKDTAPLGESLWDRFRNKAAGVFGRQGASLLRGKTTAHDVLDDAGNLLVAAGRVIDDEVIAKASGAGKIPALMAAAAAAQSQDLKERLHGEYDKTPEGQDRKNLADSETYIEARRYIRCVAGIEVTDIRGNVLVPAGKVIQDEDVRHVREAGQLAALIYSAQQSGAQPTGEIDRPAPDPNGGPVRRRTAVPLGETYDEEKHQ